MKIAKFERHSQSQCADGLSQPPPSPTSIEGILSKPSDTPLTPLEEHLTTSLVRHQMHPGGSGRSPILHVKTGGQVHHHCNTNNYCTYPIISLSFSH